MFFGCNRRHILNHKKKIGYVRAIDLKLEELSADEQKQVEADEAAEAAAEAAEAAAGADAAIAAEAPAMEPAAQTEENNTENK